MQFDKLAQINTNLVNSMASNRHALAGIRTELTEEAFRMSRSAGLVTDPEEIKLTLKLASPAADVIKQSDWDQLLKLDLGPRGLEALTALRLSCNAPICLSDFLKRQSQIKSFERKIALHGGPLVLHTVGGLSFIGRQCP
jgi:hypothetical protein